MNNLITIDNVIKQAKQKGVDFGKGDPYNRLRYYTKIGWLPHMTRQKDDEGSIKGHYPAWVVDQIALIENLKVQGLSNEEIERQIKTKNKFQTIISTLTSKEIRNQIILYTMFALVLVIVANEIGIINIGNSKNNLKNIVGTTSANAPAQIVAEGTAFIPANQRSVFVRAPYITPLSHVYVAFNQDYSPAARYWVSQIKDQEGFLVETDAPVATSAEFSWWLSN